MSWQLTEKWYLYLQIPENKSVYVHFGRIWNSPKILYSFLYTRIRYKKGKAKFHFMDPSCNANDDDYIMMTCLVAVYDLYDNTFYLSYVVSLFL